MAQAALPRRHPRQRPGPSRSPQPCRHCWRKRRSIPAARNCRGGQRCHRPARPAAQTQRPGDSVEDRSRPSGRLRSCCRCRSLDHRRPRVRLAPVPRHRRLSEPQADARFIAASGTEMVTADPPHQPRRRGGKPRRSDPQAHPLFAQYGGLSDRQGRGADRRARARSARNELDQARGHRRPRAALSRHRAARARHRDAGWEGVHRLALLHRRPRRLPQARRCRRGSGDAARLSNRVRARHLQSASDRIGLCALAGAGRPRCRHRHRVRCRAARGLGCAAVLLNAAVSKARGRCKMASSMAPPSSRSIGTPGQAAYEACPRNRRARNSASWDLRGCMARAQARSSRPPCAAPGTHANEAARAAAAHRYRPASSAASPGRSGTVGARGRVPLGERAREGSVR